MARALFLFFVLALLALTGCAKVAGSDDIELTYEGDIEQSPDVRSNVLRRLSAAGPIGADVTQEGKTLKIVVDEGQAATVDEMVTWPGTVLLLEPDPLAPGQPHDAAGLTSQSETLPDGTVSHYWEGTHTAVAKAIEHWVGDADHRAVAEPIWGTARGLAETRYRTRVLWTRTVTELGAGILVSWGDRGALRLRAAKGTPAETALKDAHARSQTTSLILVRGRTSLGRPSFEPDALHLDFGAGIEAYARAQDEKQLLTTPLLPVLHRVDAMGLPPNAELQAACYVVPILLSIAYLVFIRRFDRAHPEPLWLIALTFVMGGFSTILAELGEVLFSTLSPWLDPRVVTLGGQMFALPLAFVVFTVVVGMCEEGAKLLGAMVAVRRHEFDEPIDGIVYGIVSSLGFAAAENIRYFAALRLAAPVVVGRTFMSVPAHMFFGAIWGYALGARLVERKSRVLLFLVIAAAAHGLFDALLSMDGGGMFAVLLNVVLASVFVVVVRRSLRHGVVDAAVRDILPEHRLFFRVGRPHLFALASLALHVLAFGIVMLGGWYQLTHHRPSVPFVIGSSIMLALLAVAAFGVSSTMPLDVAVDDYGVTFAGAARAWSRIRSFAVKGNHIDLDCEAGPIRLGPGAPDVMGTLAATLREHLGGNRVDTLESVKD